MRIFAELSIRVRSVDSKTASSIKIDIKKKISPNCDMQKTFNAALMVLTLLTQYWIKRKETKLIHSQKKIREKRSPDVKKKNAN